MCDEDYTAEGSDLYKPGKPYPPLKRCGVCRWYDTDTREGCSCMCLWEGKRVSDNLEACFSYDDKNPDKRKNFINKE